jgi:SpoVK/Ycf46/Vps4 family AAA+-type ATPase
VFFDELDSLAPARGGSGTRVSECADSKCSRSLPIDPTLILSDLHPHPTPANTGQYLPPTQEPSHPRNILTNQHPSPIPPSSHPHQCAPNTPPNDRTTPAYICVAIGGVMDRVVSQLLAEIDSAQSLSAGGKPGGDVSGCCTAPLTCVLRPRCLHCACSVSTECGVCVLCPQTTESCVCVLRFWMLPHFVLPCMH